MNAPLPGWQRLFTSERPDSPVVNVPMKLLTKRGQPLLLLPPSVSLARRGLELYPAQTWRSRLLRSLAGWGLEARLPLGVQTVLFPLSPADAFVRWLGARAGLVSGRIPRFAMLAGNPNQAGQRFILMLFDDDGQPATIVKAGLNDAAQRLIEREQRFLENAPVATPGLPQLRGTFTNSNLRAIAFDFLPGRSPRKADESGLPKILGSWLRSDTPMAWSNTPCWREMAAVLGAHPIFQSLSVSLRNQISAGVIAHGDFAPWNVRVAPGGEWIAVDWERGELQGLPAWDWLHYFISTWILVERKPAARIAGAIEGLLVGREFMAYAHAARIIGQERSLALLYLLYHTEIIRPSEGLTVTRDLIKHLAARWQ